ncbi:MAG: DUF1232 domain-containing protein [Oscillospiraceae bacterium]|nr:DUF1232 domain-containing protein [Oscillospiraceae bacterium]
MSLKEKARQLHTDIPAVYIALKKKETPKTAKILAAITMIYALSPIDLIPDFVPVLGYLDDIIILPVLIALTVRLIPPDVFDVCRAHAESIWKDGIPEKWYFALPVVAIWLLAIYLIIKAIWF